MMPIFPFNTLHFRCPSSSAIIFKASRNLYATSPYCSLSRSQRLKATERACREGVMTLQLNMPSTGEENFRTKTKRTFFGTYVMLILPATTFFLGCWQWERHKWKTALIEKIKRATNQPPIDFPTENVSALDEMEFQKVRIRGFYCYDRQFFIRWRSRFDPMASADPNANSGAHIVTPMRLEGTNLTIMVNRGWLPADKVDSEMEKGRKLKLSGLKELNAIVRSGEKGSLFARNDPEKGVWAYKDLEQMGRYCGAAPFIVDADFESTEADGPIGGQTNVTLRNQHHAYMLQWFVLSATLLGVWAMQFL